MSRSDYSSLHPDDRRFLELMEKWQRGDFTRTDERDVEGLIQGDAFRREAWEGLLSAPDVKHQDRLAALSAKMNLPGHKPYKIVPFWLMTAAATVVIIFGAIWFWPDSKPEGKQAVQNPESTMDTIESNFQDDLAAVTETAKPPQFEKTKKIKIAPGTKPILEESTLDESASGAPEAVMIEPEAVKNISRKIEDFHQAVEPAKSPEKNQDFAVERMKKPVSAAPASKLRTEGSLDALQLYLRQTARLNDLARNNNISGSVRVRFFIAADGFPGDFQLVRSLGYGLDEEAINLLRVWRFPSGESRTVEVDVPFIR